MQIGFYVLAFIFGAIIGSFLCCQARRMRHREKSKYRLGSRSVCLHCKYRLSWYDNIPIISWLILRGKCRKCHKKIGLAEFLSEILCGLAFLSISTTMDISSTNLWQWFYFTSIIVYLVIICFLAIYDGLYGELPGILLYASFIPAFLAVLLKLLSISMLTLDTFLPYLGGAAVFGGLYLILFLISKGKWVGDGDWILAASIGLVLGSPWLSLIAIFIANLSATIIMYPILKKLRTHKLYFGPFMVFAFVIVFTFADFLKAMI